MARFRFPFRWRIVLLLFLLSLVNYLDRQALSVLAPILRRELGFSAVEYSYVVTSFLVAYLIGHTVCGTIIDRWGVRIAVAAAVLFWSAAGMLHALASTWVTLALCRFLLGFGESFGSPCSVKAIAEWIPNRERGLCMAIFSNGHIWGAIVAPPMVSWIALRFDWQWSFVVTGALGFIYVAGWLLFYQSPEKHPRVEVAEREYILSQRVGAGESAWSTVSILTTLRNPR